jgi:hypothetical protein
MTMSLDTLKAAITNCRAIEFEYNKAGKTSGVRIGNPHAVYIMRRKDNTESTKIDIVQTGGVSDSGQEFPSFRMFDIEEISNVKIIENLAPFIPSSEYKPESDRYAFVIIKI